MNSAKEGKFHWEKRLLHLLCDSTRLERISQSLAAPFHQSGIQYVVAFEALGFPLGAMVARLLGTGLVLMRKTQTDDASPGFEREPIQDYSGDAKAFKVMCGAIPLGARVLVVDDYYQTGGQLKAAISLIQRFEAILVAATFIGRSTRDRSYAL